jgi:dolichyl-phosphate-mannose--protein O-mannosyl transferase
MDHICYGAVITLKHEAYPAFLYSELAQYVHAGTSGQQMVGAVPDETTNCHWLLKPAHAIDPTMLSGRPIHAGDVVRLEHIPTKRNLHTHNDRPAPSCGFDQKEVTCYGENGHGNSDDNWIVELPSGGSDWLTGQSVRLVNQAILAALHSHDRKFTIASSSFQEVTGHPNGRRDTNDFWNASICPESARSSKSNQGDWRAWARDGLSIISSLCSITGVTLLWVHSIVGSVRLVEIITYTVALVGSLAIMLLAAGCESLARKMLSALGNHVVWGSRLLLIIAAPIAGGFAWVAIVKTVRELLHLVFNVVGGSP